MQQLPEPVVPPEPFPADSGPKFLIHTITIDTGEFSALAVDVSDILPRYQERELGNIELFALIRDVTNRYAEQGYATTTIGLIPKNIKQGTVALQVNWGCVDGWLINGQPPQGIQEQLITATAMPGVVGKPLNIHQVDQMVENLNNAAKTARVDIQPSPRVGYSYLNLITEGKGLPTVSLRGDNSGLGSPSNGRYRYTVATSLSDLLLGNDTLGLNLSSRRYLVVEDNSEYTAGASYSVPFGYSKVDLRFNHSQYEKLLPGGSYGSYSSSGNSQTYSSKFTQVLTREKTQKLSASVELVHKRNVNHLETTRLRTSSVPYSSLAFGLEHVTQFLGGSLYSDITYSKGLSAWGSAQSAYEGKEAPKTGDRQSKNFQKIAFNSAWSRPFNWLEHDFNFSSRLGGQYSKDNLLTAEKIGLGDEFTVRGFRGPPLWGDQGIYLSNTVTLPLNLLGGTVSPLIGLDSGYARDITYQQNSGGITGLAIGASASWRYGGASLTLGVPLAMDEAIKDSTDASVLYLSTYLTF
ncbi:ShlB/FhaC/HecB family hemolysin secretion/activation protein [Pseudomonas sp. TE3786]